MMLADCEPWTELPGWMYHGQEPPPAHKLVMGHAGITWVDLVFPFFLFSLGMAIPLAGRRRIERGQTPWQVVLCGVWRSIALVGFAFFVQHLAPYSMSDNPTDGMFLIGLVGFGLALPIFSRLPSNWSRLVRWGTRIVGCVLALALIQSIRYPQGLGWSWDRSDGIILILATVFLIANAAWVYTRNNPAARWWIVAVVLAASLGADAPGSPIKSVWDWNGLHWVFQPAFLLYLTIALPGTIVGDRIATQGVALPSAPKISLGLASACLGMIPAMAVAYYARLSPWLPELGLGATILCLNLRFHDRTQTQILSMGLALLTVGNVLEPFQGGIKKVPETLSYLLATTGLAILVLVGFIQLLNARPNLSGINFLAGAGQNPLLAYLAMTNLAEPIWELTAGKWIGGFDLLPWPELGLAIIQTMFLGVLVILFSRKRVVFRV